MDFRLDPEQRELQDSLRRFCAERFPPERTARQDEPPLDRTAWRELARLGVFSLLAPADDGGVGAGLLEAAIVFEQLGAHLVGGPVLWTALAAPLLEGAAAGERIVGGVDLFAGGDEPVIVEHAGEIDALLILRREGVFVCSAPELPGFAPLAPLDPLTPAGRCEALPAGSCVGGAQDAERLRRCGTLLCSALLLGVSSAAAKILAGDAALQNARAAIQLHGGIGFTWEMLPSHLLKRAWVLEHSFGDADTHALAVGACLVGGLA